MLIHHAGHHLDQVSNASVSGVCHWKICRQLDKIAKLVSEEIQGSQLKLKIKMKGLKGWSLHYHLSVVYAGFRAMFAK